MTCGRSASASPLIASCMSHRSPSLCNFNPVPLSKRNVTHRHCAVLDGGGGGEGGGEGMRRMVWLKVDGTQCFSFLPCSKVYKVLCIEALQ